ncbi:DNA polymerase delta small subunit Cdc1 [Coemansia helicoidea]|uniref:DNA polymerase delta small subunit Cdc1 n=1 Tax=Coemansia helicoidea TaxID=1286919 RepID=A0ACC1KYU5_9FUNG|nr:DNA polymerase delta small subunit Cdc1 [Coemansia helicoidea]
MLAMDVDQAVLVRTRVPRADADRHGAEFRTGRRTYKQQFNQMYYQRLAVLQPFVRQQAQQKWEEGAQTAVRWTERVLNVEGPATTYIIGTVFIDTAAKPSTLAQVEESRWITDPPPPASYRGADEQVFLEDESGRIRLVGPLVRGATLASGVVAAVLGRETPDGDFEAADVCFAGMAPQRPRVVDDTQDKFVALVSGLRATVDCPVSLEMQLLAEFLVGDAGGAADQRMSAQIVQTVVVGGVMVVPEAPVGRTEDAKANDRGPVQQLVAEVDAFLADIAAAMPLTLLPGGTDPTDVALPQQPLHPGMFAACRRYAEFRSTTNPAYFEVDGTVLLASAGQNVDDLARYAVCGETPCELAAASLQWRHIAPSAPDTLWCYPFTQHDPFVMRDAPHVYVVGGQVAPDSGLATGADGQETRIVVVPEFAAAHTIVLLNLRTLECTPVHVTGLPA